MNLKKTGAAAVLVMLPLWLGYYLGHRDGIQEERRAWLATEQAVAASPPTSTSGRPAIQTSRWNRTYYTYPHSGQTFVASKGPMPVNQPDLRNTPAR